MVELKKLCTRCGKTYPLTTEYFYPARKLDRKKIGWQSYCKTCWKDINLANKERRKAEYGEDPRRSRNVINQYFKTVMV